jgi:hypothetical protein
MTSPPKKRASGRGPTAAKARSNPAWDEALALRRAGRPAEALEALARGAGTGPGARAHPETRKLRGLLHADQAQEREAAGDIEGTAALLLSALADAPSFPDLHHRLGLARLRLLDLGARAPRSGRRRSSPAYAARLELALLEARQNRREPRCLPLGEAKPAAAHDEFQRGLARWRSRLGGGETCCAVRSASTRARRRAPRQSARCSATAATPCARARACSSRNIRTTRPISHSRSCVAGAASGTIAPGLRRRPN